MVWNEFDEEIILRDLDDILYIDEILEFGDNEDFDIFFFDFLELFSDDDDINICDVEENVCFESELREW